MNESQVFREIFLDLKLRGKKVSPRGELVIEIENYTYRLPPRVRFCNFEARKLNLNYIKREFLWYLVGNRYDQSILEHAKMWQSLVNQDGSINSNYGQYIFHQEEAQRKNLFTYVVETLESDKDSRRASMTILDRNHLLSQTKDFPCTYSLNFRVRENKLNMTVHMRSQDAVFGMGNDAPCFSFIHEMVWCSLLHRYPDLELGNYTHFADSFHIYERHFEVMEKITLGDQYVPVECPEMVLSEAGEMRNTAIARQRGEPFTINPNFHFTKWLTTLN